MHEFNYGIKQYIEHMVKTEAYHLDDMPLVKTIYENRLCQNFIKTS